MATPTAFVFRAVQRRLDFDHLVPVFPLSPANVGNPVAPAAAMVPDADLGPVEAAADPDLNGQSTVTDPDSVNTASATANGAAPEPTHYLLFPQCPSSPMPAMQHIVNGWRQYSKSPWISLTDSLLVGVYHTCMANFMAGRTGYRPRDLYALEVSRDTLHRYARPVEPEPEPEPGMAAAAAADGDDVDKAHNCAAVFDEWVAHRMLVVYRYEQVEIPTDVLVVSFAWFADRARPKRMDDDEEQVGKKAITFPFAVWREHMRVQLPGWLGRMRNPVEVWQGQVPPPTAEQVQEEDPEDLDDDVDFGHDDDDGDFSYVESGDEDVEE